MEELLKYEERQNEAWTSLPGGTALWFWRPVLGACGFVQEPGRHLAAAPQPLAAPPSALVHAHQQAAAKARAAAAKPVRPLRLQAAEPAAQP